MREIKIILFGQERLVSLEDLIKIYRELGDPTPEENARKNFETHLI
ncbi:MAG: hypothetical protein IKE01_01620 [Clostridia bacterium]|nr:hypothetical protein [Clostridia bacterium]MBR2785877.1 hypothetical protein [Clostridia bacterium]